MNPEHPVMKNLIEAVAKCLHDGDLYKLPIGLQDAYRADAKDMLETAGVPELVKENAGLRVLLEPNTKLAADVQQEADALRERVRMLAGACRIAFGYLEPLENDRATWTREQIRLALADAPEPHPRTMPTLAKAADDDCPLIDCPPGLFLFDGVVVGLKTKDAPGVRMQVFNADGEKFFWDGTSDETRAGLIVTPLAIVPPVPKP